MQVIKTKHFGPISFEKTWVSSDGRHIGKLTKGGYAHLSGSPVTSKKDLADLIPAGNDRKDAQEWFANKDKKDFHPNKKRIFLKANGDYEWEDGTALDDPVDVYNNLAQGKQLEAVLTWLREKQAENAEPGNDKVKVA
jgi:hypothetical protein